MWTKMSTAVLFIILKKWKQPSCPTGRGLNTLQCIQTMEQWATIQNVYIVRGRGLS